MKSIAIIAACMVASAAAGGYGYKPEPSTCADWTGSCGDYKHLIPDPETVNCGTGYDKCSVVCCEKPVYEKPSYEPPAYEKPSYEPPAYEKPSYKPPAYEKPSYEPPAYEKPSYEPPAYEKPSYKPPAYEKPSYKPPAYEKPSYKPPTYHPVTHDYTRCKYWEGECDYGYTQRFNRKRCNADGDDSYYPLCEDVCCRKSYKPVYKPSYGYGKY